MEATEFWFVLITVLFTGFFILEGFDYGVGTLLPFIGKNDIERRTVLSSIAPVWDGNEVWMITAGGALFAAFPHVYATMFSAFYLALFLMLVALILRGVAFELRNRYPSNAWKKTFDNAIFFGSLLPAFLWGVAVTDLIGGIPINEKMIFTGNFFNLLTGYSLFGGIVFAIMFTYQGATFLTVRLKDKELLERAFSKAESFGVRVVVFFIFFAGLTVYHTDFEESKTALLLFILAVVAFALSFSAVRGKNSKKAFILSSVGIALTTISVFVALFPRLMVSSMNPDYSLTIFNAASTPYTLSIMTKAAIALVPVVLIYQGISYYIFRKRVSGEDLGEH
ncbi:MAG: cytochrome d ubiquinol oxidase subunit II [Selenomonadaceae bacterium]|nr:cytochrome d ubiquinol oxidase subunit II [Selenomonadaceae bacterium]MBP3723042.1 cytochrome d ubiquinol oxidase subunit II [Selenomonadaceae bacterium]